MPCKSCKDKKKQRQQLVQQQVGEVKRLTPHLDNAENEFLIASLNEIAPENLQYVNQFLELIRLMKNVPYATRPLQARFYNLLVATNEAVQEIGCPYCRRHMEYRWLGAIKEAIEADRGHYYHLLKLLLRNEIRGSYWLLLAFWYRKLWPSLWSLPYMTMRMLRRQASPLSPSTLPPTLGPLKEPST